MNPKQSPFRQALSLPAFFCDNCGFWQRHFAQPDRCPLCIDARHVLPRHGWRFHDLADAERRYTCHWSEIEVGVWRFFNDPVEGIASSGYLIRTPGGNVAFEGCAVYSTDALAFIESLGGVRFLAASHPHSYGAIWQLQDRFEPELALHPGDLAWSSALRVTWPFDATLALAPGVSLHLTGGHFDGHTVLYDATRKILFCGDCLKFEMDATNPRRADAISAHKAFVRSIPLTPDELRRYRAVFAELDFVQTWTPFEQAANSGRHEALALIDSMLATRPHARPVSLRALGVAARTGII